MQREGEAEPVRSPGLKRGKIAKSAFFKKRFLTTWPLGGSKKLYHMKFKSKTGYLGEKIASYLGKWLRH